MVRWKAYKRTIAANDNESIRTRITGREAIIRCLAIINNYARLRMYKHRQPVVDMCCGFDVGGGAYENKTLVLPCDIEKEERTTFRIDNLKAEENTVHIAVCIQEK